VGLAVSLGHLKLVTERAGGRTSVVHALTGADRRITHQIELRPRYRDGMRRPVLSGMR
jgi:hypothetical protein